VHARERERENEGAKEERGNAVERVRERRGGGGGLGGREGGREGERGGGGGGLGVRDREEREERSERQQERACVCERNARETHVVFATWEGLLTSAVRKQKMVSQKCVCARVCMCVFCVCLSVCVHAYVW